MRMSGAPQVCMLVLAALLASSGGQASPTGLRASSRDTGAGDAEQRAPGAERDLPLAGGAAVPVGGPGQNAADAAQVAGVVQRSRAAPLAPHQEEVQEKEGGMEHDGKAQGERTMSVQATEPEHAELGRDQAPGAEDSGRAESEQAETEQDGELEQRESEQDGQSEQAEPEQANSEPAESEQGESEHAEPEQAKNEPAEAEQGESEQGGSSQAGQSEHGQAGQPHEEGEEAEQNASRAGHEHGQAHRAHRVERSPEERARQAALRRVREAVGALEDLVQRLGNESNAEGAVQGAAEASQRVVGSAVAVATKIFGQRLAAVAHASSREEVEERARSAVHAADEVERVEGKKAEELHRVVKRLEKEKKDEIHRLSKEVKQAAKEALKASRARRTSRAAGGVEQDGEVAELESSTRADEEALAAMKDEADLLADLAKDLLKDLYGRASRSADEMSRTLRDAAKQHHEGLVGEVRAAAQKVFQKMRRSRSSMTRSMAKEAATQGGRAKPEAAGRAAIQDGGYAKLMAISEQVPFSDDTITSTVAFAFAAVCALVASAAALTGLRGRSGGAAAAGEPLLGSA